jgi:uncharacterized protein (DUF433 family)
MIPTPTAVEVPLRTEEGVIRIGKSRVTLDAVIVDHQRGASPEEIAQHYPSVDVGDVYLVIGYHMANRAEVDAYIVEQERLADEARRAYEAEYPHTEFRERLRAALRERRQSEK